MLKKLFILLFMSIATVAFAQEKRVFIGIGENYQMFEKASDDLKRYFENKGLKVLVGKYVLLPKITSNQFDYIVVLNGNRTSGYAKEVEEFTQSFPAKEKVVVSNWFKNRKKGVSIDSPLNGVDVVTAASSMEHEQNAVFNEIAKAFGL